nr:6928_t:CDS:2 [Entrophospora candida]
MYKSIENHFVDGPKKIKITKSPSASIFPVNSVEEGEEEGENKKVEINININVKQLENQHMVESNDGLKLDDTLEILMAQNYSNQPVSASATHYSIINLRCSAGSIKEAYCCNGIVNNSSDVEQLNNGEQLYDESDFIG